MWAASGAVAAARPQAGPDEGTPDLSGGSAYVRTGTEDGGWMNNRPPKSTPVPSEGGWSPTSWFVPTVTSASAGSSLPRSSPTTAPCAPSPADTWAVASGVLAGGTWLGAGGASPPPPGGAPPPEAPGPLAEPEPVPGAGPAAAAEEPEVEAPPAALRPVRVTPWTTADSSEPAPPDAAAGGSATPPVSAPLAGPLLVAGPGCPSPGTVLEVDDGPVATGLSSSPSEIREMATPLESSTTKADAKASPTCALLSLPFATERTPDPPARCLNGERNTAHPARSLTCT